MGSDLLLDSKPMNGRWRKRRAERAGSVPVAACAVLMVVSLILASAAPSGAATSARGPNYCSIPSETTNEPWGFNTNDKTYALTGATGSFARGHGYFNPSAHTSSGIMCQVDRPRNRPDQEIKLSIGPHPLYYSHTAVKWGHPGNEVKLAVRVKSSSVPSSCPVGTKGVVTVFASYNNVHDDSVQFSWPPACASHRHLYHSQKVMTNVMPA